MSSMFSLCSAKFCHESSGEPIEIPFEQAFVTNLQYIDMDVHLLHDKLNRYNRLSATEVGVDTNNLYKSAERMFIQWFKYQPDDKIFAEIFILLRETTWFNDSQNMALDRFNERFDGSYHWMTQFTERLLSDSLQQALSPTKMWGYRQTLTDISVKLHEANVNTEHGKMLVSGTLILMHQSVRMEAGELTHWKLGARPDTCEELIESFESAEQWNWDEGTVIQMAGF